jgi:DNA-binding helix-hairpin-helix protein with protein kinase domain
MLKNEIKKNQFKKNRKKSKSTHANHQNTYRGHKIGTNYITKKANTKKQRSKILNKKSLTMKPRSNNLKKIMKKDPSQPTIGLTRHKNK